MKYFAATLLLSALLVFSVSSIQVKSLLDAESQKSPSPTPTPAPKPAPQPTPSPAPFQASTSTTPPLTDAAKLANFLHQVDAAYAKFNATTSPNNWKLDFTHYRNNLGNAGGKALAYTWL